MYIATLETCHCHRVKTQIVTFFAEELCPELVSITKISGSRDIFAIAYLMISNNATNIFEALYKHDLPVMS